MSVISSERGTGFASFELLEGRTLFSVALNYAGSVVPSRAAVHAAPSAPRATPSAVHARRRALDFWAPVTVHVYTSSLPGTLSLAALDVNGDTRPDLIFNTADGYTTVLFNESRGVFTSNGRFDNGTDPTHAHTQYLGSSLQIGPLSGSGRFDLAVASYDTYQNTAHFAILPSNGDGTYGLPISQDGPAGPVQLLGGGDANSDLTVDLFGAFGTHGRVLTNNGAGSFSPGTTLDTTHFDVTDLNGDGIPDVIESSGGTTNNNGPTVRLGKGDGTFGPGKDLPFLGGAASWTFKVADYNLDSSPDIIATDSGSSNGSSKLFSHVYLLKGNGNGTFGAPVLLAKTSNGGASKPAPVYTITVGDFNADGNGDLAIISPVYGGANNSHIRGYTLHVLLGTGKGSFYSGPTRQLFGNDFSTPRTAVADLDADGKPDLIVSGLRTGDAQIFFSF